jgi:hypothetical protein
MGSERCHPCGDFFWKFRRKYLAPIPVESYIAGVMLTNTKHERNKAMTTKSELIGSFPSKVKANVAKIKAMKAGWTNVAVTQEGESWAVNGVKPADEPAKPAPADKKAKETLTIPELLKKLETATAQREKKMIRRALRAAGHKGGLGKPKKVKQPKE